MKEWRTLRLTGAMALLLGADSAQSALVTVSANQPVISVGETLTLSVEGLINPFFEPGSSVDVRLALPASVTLLGFSADTGEQQSFGGPLFNWDVGPLQGTAVGGSLVVFSQTAPPGSNGITNFCGGNGFCASLTASIQLRANSPGTLDFDFSTVAFFGATLGQGTQVTVVPEPASAGLLALGLCAVALGRQRRLRATWYGQRSPARRPGGPLRAATTRGPPG